VIEKMARTKEPRADKVQTVDDIATVFERSKGIIMTHYRGLTVSEITTLRGKLRASGGEYHVVKNTLFRRAAGDKLTPELNELVSGPTAIAFAMEDPVATTKALLDFIREVRKQEIVVKGGLVDGKVYGPAQITALSKLPPREVILAQALGTIQGPLNSFAGTLHGVLSEFARTMQALADKRQAEAA